MKNLAQTECLDRDWSFVDTFRHHYLIAPKDHPRPEGWLDAVLGGWRLSHCPDLPLSKLTLSDGTAAGLVLGYAISPDGMMLGSSEATGFKARDKSCIDRLEQYIEQLAGRFVVLLNLGETTRVYSDPAAGMGPVYWPKKRRLGASLPLVLDRDVIPVNPDTKTEQHYVFGQTADAEVRNARPNHYIDLNAFEVTRHWPRDTTPFDTQGRSSAEVAEEIGVKLGLNMKALSQRHRTALPITGGTDSRLLLAAGHDHCETIDQFFVYHTNWANSFDTQAALEIAQTMCLPLRVISADSPLYQRGLYSFQMRQLTKKRHLRGGYLPEKAERGSIRAMTMLPDDLIVMRGNVAEMTRGLRWHKSVFNDPHNTDFALAKLDIYQDRCRRYPHWAEEFQVWKDTLPAPAIPRIYDMLHMELWVSYSNSGGYIRDVSQFNLNPFSDRRLIELTMQVPAKKRQRGALVRGIVDRFAPDLQDIPFKIERIKALKAA